MPGSWRQNTGVIIASAQVAAMNVEFSRHPATKSSVAFCEASLRWSSWRLGWTFEASPETG